MDCVADFFLFDQWVCGFVSLYVFTFSLWGLLLGLGYCELRAKCVGAIRGAGFFGALK